MVTASSAQYSSFQQATSTSITKFAKKLSDFIESKDNLTQLRAFLGHHNTGKDYVLSSKMRQHAWATEVEMMSLALFTGKDLVCYYNQKWE